MEIWTMAADGIGTRQLTHNALHDEGPAWSPDGGRLLAYTSGADDEHGDIHVMTARRPPPAPAHDFAGLDESPDWQAIPAPTTARRCGDAVRSGPGAHDVRATGRGLTCARALALARRWSSARTARGAIGGFAVARRRASAGRSRVVMTRRARRRAASSSRSCFSARSRSARPRLARISSWRSRSSASCSSGSQKRVPADLLGHDVLARQVARVGVRVVVADAAAERFAAPGIAAGAQRAPAGSRRRARGRASRARPIALHASLDFGASAR